MKRKNKSHHCSGMPSTFNHPTGQLANWLTLFSVLVISLQAASAQNFTRRVDGLSVEREGQRLEFPFFGGLDRFIPQFVDFDGDGEVDLLLAEADGQLVWLKNIGAAGAHKFRLNSERLKKLNVGSWFYFVDSDADGDLDLYHANGNNGLVFQRNTGATSNPNFVLETATVVTEDNQPVFSEVTSIPTFADIDADGDFDFFTGIITGEIAFYQNAGSRSASVLQFNTSKWQDLLIFSFGAPLSTALGKKPQHGANAIEFVDIDADGDLDFFYGDLFHKGLYFLRNDGAPNNAQVAITDTLFPRGQPVQTSGYNIPRFADIDGDGDQDLFIASLLQSQNNFIWYKNSGTARLPNFQAATTNFLTMIDAGSNAVPAFADIDADGDQDLCIGNLDGQISFYENSGTATAPAWRWVTDNLPNVQPNLHFSAAPAFADLDADGDLDLLVGSSFGRLVFYENHGSQREANFVLITSMFENITVGGSSAPYLVDADRDGDADLFIGTAIGGTVQLHENIGSARQPHFQLKKQIRPAFNAEDAVPFLYDWTGDDILDLFIGIREGTMLYYRGVAADSFAFVQNDFAGIDAGFYAAPVFTDINGDGHVDLFVGEGDGGVNFFEGAGSSAVVEPIYRPPNSLQLSAHPNPFRRQINILLRFAGANQELPPRVSIYSLTGARAAEIEMQRAPNGLWRGNWAPAKSNLASGIYFLQVNLEKERLYQKILFIR